MTPNDDPDINHLFELLSMLPGPTENRDFWTEVQHRAVGPDTNLGYVYEKMTSIWRMVRSPSPRKYHLPY